MRLTGYLRRRFPGLYTRADIELRASVDEAHETLSGPATRRILEREVQLYGRREYARLAALSVAHLYNLRKSQRYRERRLNYVKTRPTAVSIGERRKAQPKVQPGYLRLDTVHQGDQPGGGAGTKGVYPINAADEVNRIVSIRLYRTLEHYSNGLSITTALRVNDDDVAFVNALLARRVIGRLRAPGRSPMNVGVRCRKRSAW